MEDKFTLRNGLKSVVTIRYHQDRAKQDAFASVLHLDDWSAQDEKSFFFDRMPSLIAECEKRSKHNYPTFEFSKRVFVYQNGTPNRCIEQIGDLKLFRRGEPYCKTMAALDKVIEDFVEHYKNELFETYQQVAEDVRRKIAQALKEMKVPALVTARAKEEDSLRDKLRQRSVPPEEPKASYVDAEDIKADIVDLAGVRVALYFPDDRKAVAQVLGAMFTEKGRKEFPEKPKKKHWSPRFSGYAATHLRVEVRDVGKKKGTYNLEIQIASVIMHAYAEVEHDFEYKQANGVLTDLELQLLDQLNGLALTGEIALEQLQEARNKRISNEKLSSLAKNPP